MNGSFQHLNSCSCIWLMLLRLHHKLCQELASYKKSLNGQVELVTSITPYVPLPPHDIPNSWRRRDHGGGGVVAEPDWLVALQTLSPELIQHVELSLSSIEGKKNSVRTAPFIIYIIYSIFWGRILLRILFSIIEFMFPALFVIYVLTCMCSALPSVLTFIIWE